MILGNEAAGVIEEVGEGVTDFKPGERVAYGFSTGAYATERVMATASLVKLPEAISDETAAAMMLKGLTASYLLRADLPGSARARPSWSMPPPAGWG